MSVGELKRVLSAEFGVPMDQLAVAKRPVVLDAVAITTAKWAWPDCQPICGSPWYAMDGTVLLFKDIRHRNCVDVSEAVEAATHHVESGVVIDVYSGSDDKGEGGGIAHLTEEEQIQLALQLSEQDTPAGPALTIVAEGE
jgi:hypothetical protein